MDSEDKLKEQFEKEKAKLNQDWQQKCNRAVDEMKRQTEATMGAKMKEMQETLTAQIQNQHEQIVYNEGEIKKLEEKLRQKELVINGKDEEIA